MDNTLMYTRFIFVVVQGNKIEGFENSVRMVNEEVKKGTKKPEEEE